MAGRPGGRLAAYVSVAQPNGTFEHFGPDDEVPAWAAAKITNPAAWAEPPTAVGVPSAATAEGTPTPEPPPRGGPGSGAAAWRAYADQLGVTVADDAGRDDVIDAVAAAGRRID